MATPQDRDPLQHHFRMQLNNHLQDICGTKRFRWGKPIKSGPDDCPSWSIDAFLDDKACGYGTGGDLKTAKEKAACQVLRHLLGPDHKP